MTVDLIKLNRVLRELGYISFPSWNDDGKIHPFVSWTYYRDLNRRPTKEEFAQIDRDFFDKRCCAIQYIAGLAFKENGEPADCFPFCIDADNTPATNEVLKLNKEDPSFEGLAKIEGIIVEPSDSKEKLHLHGLTDDGFKKIKLEPIAGRDSPTPFIECISDKRYLCTIGKPGYSIVDEDRIHRFADMSRYQKSTMIKKFFDGIKDRFKDGYPIEEEETKGTGTTKKYNSLSRNTEPIPEGRRKRRIFSYAISLILRNHKILNRDSIYEFLKVFNNNPQEVTKPLPQKDLDDVFKGAWNIAEKLFKENNNDKQDSKSVISFATELIMDKYKLITIQETKEILYYKNGVYTKDAEALISRECEDMFLYDLNDDRLNQILNHIRRQTFHKHEELDADKNIINLKNGLYHINENLLTEHTPDYLSINQKPIVYDKFAKAERFQEFLNQSVAEGQIRTATEAMAYTFERDYPYEIIFTLLGNGQNGKSVYTSVLTALHGVDHVSNVTLTDMIGDTFALADLEDKDLNIDNELGGETIKDTAVLKRLTGGSRQRIRIQRKNEDAYDTILYAKLFFNANKIPMSTDTSDAYNRRVIIITFPKKFEGAEADPKLTDKLATESEKSGIFNILMESLRTIRQMQEVYVNEKTILERRLRYTRATDSIKAFIDETIDAESTESDYIPKFDLYYMYCVYCKEYRLPAIEYNPFCKKIKNISPIVFNDSEDGSAIIIGEKKQSLYRKNESGNIVQTPCLMGIKFVKEFNEKYLAVRPDIIQKDILDKGQTRLA